MKMTICPKCGGELIAETIGWKCRQCQGFISVDGKFHEHTEKPFMPPMTNADHIKGMGGRELYQFADRMANECPPKHAEKPCVKDCKTCWAEWLDAPAEGQVWEDRGLRQCPFCGGKAELFAHDPYDGYQGNCTRYGVRCVDCSASVTANSKEAATAKWNGRC